jgi:hypothetical protein
VLPAEEDFPVDDDAGRVARHHVDILDREDLPERQIMHTFQLWHIPFPFPGRQP